MADPRFVQVENPITGRWVKVCLRTGRIVRIKRTVGPFKNIARR